MKSALVRPLRTRCLRRTDRREDEGKESDRNGKDAGERHGESAGWFRPLTGSDVMLVRCSGLCSPGERPLLKTSVFSLFVSVCFTSSVISAAWPRVCCQTLTVPVLVPVLVSGVWCWSLLSLCGVSWRFVVVSGADVRCRDMTLTSCSDL